MLCKACQQAHFREREKAFDYNMIKGRIAEALIEQLFVKLGYQVYRYGMENTIPGIMEELRGTGSEVGRVIRRMPDLVVARDGEAHFIEVKFRGNGCFSIDDVGGDYPFRDVFFIVVSRKHIKCLSYRELAAGERITERSRQYLADVSAFDTDRETIRGFCQYAVQFFETV